MGSHLNINQGESISLQYLLLGHLKNIHSLHLRCESKSVYKE